MMASASSACQTSVAVSARVQFSLGLQGLYLLAMGQTKAGLAVGTTTSAALLLLDIKRAYDVGRIPKPCCCTQLPLDLAAPTL